MRRFLLPFLILLLTLAVFMPLVRVHALDPLQGVCKTDSSGKPDPRNPSFCADNRSKKSSEDPVFGSQGVLVVALNVVSFVAAAIAVIAIIIAAIRMVTSVGDPKTITESRNSILFAVVGLIIIALAQLIVRFIVGRITT